MSDEFATAQAQVRSLLLDVERLASASAAGAMKGQQPRWRRIELRPVEIKGAVHVQVTRFDERQAFSENVGADATALASLLDELLAEPFGRWHVVTTGGDFAYRVTKSGKTLTTSHGESREQDLSHDRAKRRLIEPSAPFLQALGIADKGGRVKPSRTAKYRQVEEFVRVLDAALADVRLTGTSDGITQVVDLGCGNAYLTFAALHHLDGVLGGRVEMLGVDVRPAAARRNIEIARQLGWDGRLSFVESDIASVQVDGGVDIALALHACDTATDDALARGIEWGSKLILAAPCCHHDIQRQIKSSTTPPPYGLLTRSGIVRERLADLLTDSLRAHLLRRAGYRAELIEFVPSRHTPRNVLLRAELTGRGPSDDQEREYQELVREWGVRPRLEALLEGT